MSNIQKGDKVVDRYGREMTVLDVYAPYEDAVPSIKTYEKPNDWIQASNVTKIN